MAPPDGGGTGRHPIRVGAACGRPWANTVRPYNIYGQSGGASGMPRPTRWVAAAIYGGPTRLCRHLSVGPRYIATAHTCAEVWRRCGAPAEAQRSTRKGYAVSVRRQSERSGACGDVVTLRVGRMAGSLSPGSAKNAAPGCARRLFFRLRPALAPLCAYPPRFALSRSACSRRPASLRLRAQTASLRTGLVCTRRSAPSGLLTTAPRFSFGNFHKSFSESY